MDVPFPLWVADQSNPIRGGDQAPVPQRSPGSRAGAMTGA